MEPWKWGLVPILLVAIYTDWRWQRLYNWLTLPALAAGLLLSFGHGAWTGGLGGALREGVSSLAGFGLWATLFLVVGLTGGMKGGDLKLGAAIGAWLGWPLAASGLAYAAIAGGVLSVLWAAAHGALGQTFRNIRGFFLALRGGIEPTQMIPVSAAPLLPYGVSMGIGVLLAMVTPGLLPLGLGR